MESVVCAVLCVYGNIAPTGEIDEATRELLARPRCGLPDLDAPRAQRAPGGRRRPRRFALHGRKWDYTNLTWRSDFNNREVA
ncbi:Matrix metalloproteinase-16 [Gryllus bimaculatus]|nr:Matrix metalloproteinase-16 [Gryllus bimaculatus]